MGIKVKRKHKKIGMSSIVWIGIISVMFLFTVANRNFEIQSGWITLVLLVIMGGTILLAQQKCINRMIECENAIGDVVKKIKKLKSTVNESLWEEIRKEESLFENEILDEMFQNYRYEMDRLYREHEENIQCDVADYMNEYTISERLHGQLLDQLPSIMTGLGILGTFVGLVLGLNDFNNDGVEQMIGSITPLIDGIKVAFYTSIFGVTFSLLFNVYYKWVQGRLGQKLDYFYEVFYREIVPVPTNDLANQLLHYQQNQTSAMEQFAETISIQMAKSLETFSDSTFKELGTVLKTSSENIERGLHSLSEQVTKIQKESMQEVVEIFLNEINQSMNGSFTLLKKTIQELCKEQKNSSNKIQFFLEQIGQTTVLIEQINMSSGNTVQQLEEYSSKLNTYQEKINEEYARREGQEQVIVSSIQKQIEYWKEKKEQQERLIQTMNQMMEQNKKMEECWKMQSKLMVENGEMQMENFRNVYSTSEQLFLKTTNQQIELQQKSMEELSKRLNESTLGLQNIANCFNSNLQESIHKTFEQFDSNLSEIVSCLGESVIEINETTQNIPKALYSTFHTMQEQLKEYIQVIEQMKESAQNTIHEKQVGGQKKSEKTSKKKEG